MAPDRAARTVQIGLRFAGRILRTDKLRKLREISALSKNVSGLSIYVGESGAAYVTRTRDPIITNDVLYQLS